MVGVSRREKYRDAYLRPALAARVQSLPGTFNAKASIRHQAMGQREIGQCTAPDDTADIPAFPAKFAWRLATGFEQTELCCLTPCAAGLRPYSPFGQDQWRRRRATWNIRPPSPRTLQINGLAAPITPLKTDWYFSRARVCGHSPRRLLCLDRAHSGHAAARPSRCRRLKLSVGHDPMRMGWMASAPIRRVLRQTAEVIF